MITISDDKWIDVHSRLNPPAAYAEDGDLVEFLTRDCYNRSVTEESMPIEIQTKGQPDNPSTGPCMYRAQNPGMCLWLMCLISGWQTTGWSLWAAGRFRRKDRRSSIS